MMHYIYEGKVRALQFIMESDDGSAEIEHGCKRSVPAFTLLSFGIMPLNVKCGCFSDRLNYGRKTVCYSIFVVRNSEIHSK
jgi:hypothetical protein